MSREANVVIACRAYSAATRRPRPDFGTVNALFHPEHELMSTAARLEGRRARGAKEYRDWLTALSEVFESWEMEIEQAEALDDEQVLITAMANAKGKSAGVPIRQRFWQVLTVRGGKVVRTVGYSSREEALSANARQE
jgi:ketosteroid isomerase-like protein